MEMCRGVPPIELVHHASAYQDRRETHGVPSNLPNVFKRAEMAELDAVPGLVLQACGAGEHTPCKGGAL